MGKTMEFLEELFDREQVGEIEFQGQCHDCGKDVAIVTMLEKDGALGVSGGALWYTSTAKIFAKCDDCFAKNPILTNWQPCEVYSRICGYMRPVQQWNKGKKAEWDQRKPFSIPKDSTDHC